MVQDLIVFVGWDDREKEAYEVLKHSIEKYTTAHPRIIPLHHKQLRKQGFFSRPWLTQASDGNRIDLIDGRPFSTEFSHTRFLVPALMKYQGWALFMDCDMIFKCDVREVFRHCNDKYAVMCVKHDQKVKKKEKMDGSPQQAYHRKNWSSFMLFNCGHPYNLNLTPQVVNTQTGSWLHGLSWLPDDAIGDLPKTFNWIEGCSPVKERPKVIHYTMGGPWFSSYGDVMFAEDWVDLWKEIEPEPSDSLIQVDYDMI